MINISADAQKHLGQLKQQPENLNRELYLEALDVESPYAEACLELIEIGPEHVEAINITFDNFVVFVDQKTAVYLQDAEISMKGEGLNQSLFIDAPNLKPMSLLSASSSLSERVHYILESEVNPQLASHGGFVRLIEVTDDHHAVLQFGGGCQGCGMIDMTLKQGVEVSLKEKLPELAGVVDATDHAAGKMPYA